MSFYPVIGQGHPGQDLQQGARQQPPSPPPHLPAEDRQQQANSNGAGHESQCMMLRVQIAEAFHFYPQVSVKQDLGQVQRTPTVLTFDLERHLLLEQTCGGDCSSSSAMDAAAFHDPFEEAMEPYLQMGLLRDEVAMALAVYEGQEDQVVEFCRSYRELVGGMGFAPELVAGALMRHHDDLTAATEACLVAHTGL